MAIENFDQVTIAAAHIRPFSKFIMSIGEMPTSYLDSLSYAEQITWFCNFLQDKVIPAINNNAEALEEVQTLMTQLQEYVDNYFTNLDVQEEINNKLDQMVEDGVLQEIIADYLNSKAIFGYDNVASMVTSTNLINGSYAETLGYYEKNDGGKGLYKIRNRTYDDVIDNGSIILMENETLVAELISNKINVKQFGAKGNNVTSDYQSFVNAINFCKNSTYNTLYIPNGRYLIDSPIVIDFALNIEGIFSQYASQYAEINNGLTIGSIIVDGYTGTDPLIKYEYQGTSTSQEVKRIWGVKISNIQFIGNNESNHVCLYLHRTGWEGSIENVRFKDFYHTALYLDRVYDTTLKTVTISTCGSHNITGSDIPNYAMVITDSESDTTNALHVFGLHIEGCRYDLKIDKSKNNQFIGCKFEDRISDDDNSDITNPFILITSNALENTFDSCMFVPVKIDRWKELNITPNNAPYQIESQTTNKSNGILKINNSDFSTGSLQGGKFIKTGTNANKTILTSNDFFVLSSETYAIDITNGIISDNVIITWNIIESLSELKNVKITKSLLSNNIFKLVQQQTIAESYCYESGGQNIIDNLQSEGYNNMFKSTLNTDNVKYDKYFSLNNTTYLATSGVSNESVDWTNAIFDKSKFKYEEFYCSFSQATTIKSITNGQLGDEITFVNNSNNAVILGGEFDYYGTRIVCKPSNTSATLTLAGFQSARLVKNGNYWKVISTDGTIS